MKDASFEKICVPITLSKEKPFSFGKGGWLGKTKSKEAPKTQAIVAPEKVFKSGPVKPAPVPPAVIPRKEKVHVPVEASPVETRRDSVRRVIEIEKERLKRKERMKRRKYV